MCTQPPISVPHPPPMCPLLRGGASVRPRPRAPGTVWDRTRSNVPYQLHRSAVASGRSPRAEPATTCVPEQTAGTLPRVQQHQLAAGETLALRVPRGARTPRRRHPPIPRQGSPTHAVQAHTPSRGPDPAAPEAEVRETRSDHLLGHTDLVRRRVTPPCVRPPWAARPCQPLWAAPREAVQ